MVGRDRELAALRDVVKAACGGSGATIVVHGEPGIGKTALLDALIADNSVTTLRACGFESEAEFPFATLADLVRPVLEDVVNIPPVQADALRNALGMVGSVGVDAAAVGVATVSLLRTVAQRHPLLIVVDECTGPTPAR